MRKNSKFSQENLTAISKLQFPVPVTFCGCLWEKNIWIDIIVFDVSDWLVFGWPQLLIGFCCMRCNDWMIFDYRRGIIDNRWLSDAFIRRVFETRLEECHSGVLLYYTISLWIHDSRACFVFARFKIRVLVKLNVFPLPCIY